MLLTTQYLEQADRPADRIAVVDHRKVIAEGSAAELKSKLGRTVVEVGVPLGSIEQARAVLARIGPTEPLDDGRRAGVIVGDGPRGAVAVVRALDDACIPARHTCGPEPTLDAVFLQLTDRRAEDQTGEAAA